MSMQMARLFEIVQILLNEKDVTAKKLAKHFEISVRTVYRDIEALMFAGIPIYSERGKNGGIRLMEDYVMDRALISDKDQNEILYALQSLKALNYPDNNKILSKLKVKTRSMYPLCIRHAKATCAQLIFLLSIICGLSNSLRSDLSKADIYLP